MVPSTISSFCITCMKTCSWKSLTKSKVKGHIYSDKFVTGSIYVIKYWFSRQSQKSGFPSSWVHLQACILKPPRNFAILNAQGTARTCSSPLRPACWLLTRGALSCWWALGEASRVTSPIGRLVNEPKMIEIRIFRISLKINIVLHKWTP